MPKIVSRMNRNFLIIVLLLAANLISILAFLKEKTKLRDLIVCHAHVIDSCNFVQTHLSSQRPNSTEYAKTILEEARIKSVMFMVDHDIATKEAQYLVYYKTDRTEFSGGLTDDQKRRFREYLWKHDPGTKRGFISKIKSKARKILNELLRGQ